MSPHKPAGPHLPGRPATETAIVSNDQRVSAPLNPSVGDDPNHAPELSVPSRRALMVALLAAGVAPAIPPAFAATTPKPSQTRFWPFRKSSQAAHRLILHKLRASTPRFSPTIRSLLVA